MTTLIDGKALYKNYRVRLWKKTARLKEETGVVPGLVVIVVGDNPASKIYGK